MDELLNREVFYILTEARVLIEQWRKKYNQTCPQSSLAYQPTALEAILTAITTKKWYHHWGAGQDNGLLNMDVSFPTWSIPEKFEVPPWWCAGVKYSNAGR
jgi:hypothetical protein